MILRRLAGALRGQDWFTVVLEILIVVVGIFMGLQVNDWNQARQDRAVETRYLERLQRDLLTDLDRLDRSEQLATRRMQQIELLVDGIADPEVAARKPGQFIEAVEKAGWAAYRPMTPNAYLELVSTGRTTLIQSESIRDTLADYYGRIEFWEGVLNQSLLVHEFYIATAGVLDIEYLAAIEDSAGSSTALGVDGGDAISIAEELGSRTQATRLLPKLYQSHRLVKTIITEHRGRNEALQTVIEKHLRDARDDP